MKKLLTLLLLSLFIVPLALAEDNITTAPGKRHTVEFQGLQPVFFKLAPQDILGFTYPTRVYKQPELVNGSEQIEFTTEDQDHAIKIEKIGRSTNATGNKEIVELAVFIHDADRPYYPRLAKGDSLQLDFEFDEIQDLVIQVLDIDEQEGITMMLIPQNTEGLEANPHVYNGGNATPDITSGTKEPWYKRIIPKNTRISYLILAGILLIILLLLNRKSIQKYFVHKRNQRHKQE